MKRAKKCHFYIVYSKHNDFQFDIVRDLDIALSAYQRKLRKHFPDQPVELKLVYSEEHPNLDNAERRLSMLKNTYPPLTQALANRRQASLQRFEYRYRPWEHREPHF